MKVVPLKADVTWSALILGLLLSGGVVLITANFFFLEPGAELRPLGWVSAVFSAGLIGFGAALPLSVFAFVREKSWLAVAAILLALGPLPLGIVLSGIATEWLDLKWSD